MGPSSWPCAPLLLPALLLCTLGLVGCDGVAETDGDGRSGGGSGGAGGIGGLGGTGGTGGTGGSGGTGGAGGSGGGTADAGVAGLPFVYARAPAGTPPTQAELTAITDLYKDLLVQTCYFDVLHERVHGWPQSDPQGRYWYGTWRSGVGFEKSQGR